MPVLPPEIEELFTLQATHSKRVLSLKEWRRCDAALNGLFKTSRDSSNTAIEYNAVHWALDVHRLLREIVFSVAWMKAHASIHRIRTPPEVSPASPNLYVTYFADNCITRIDSCRDKLALMVWAYYVPFNPEQKREVLNFRNVLEKLRCPLKFGLRITRHEGFLAALEILQNQDFSRVEKYRDLKIHRREPKIEMYGVQPHHDFPYTLPLISDEEIARWKSALRRKHPNLDAHGLKTIEDGCRIKGVLFDQRRLKDRLWNYRDVEKHIENSLAALLLASAACFRIINKKLPRYKKLVARTS